MTATAQAPAAPPLAAPTRATRRRRTVGLLLAATLLAAMCIASLAIGTENVALSTVWQAVTNYQDIGDQWIVHDLRVPRTVLALLVGVALGLSGTLIQAVGRNPLADAEILGINSGAALFVVCAIAFLGLTGIWTYIWFAFAGALFAMLLVYLVGMTGRATVTPVRVLLAGVAVGAVMDGIGYAVRLRNPRAFDNMRFWDAGALDGRSLEVAAAVAPFIAVGVGLCFIVAPFTQRHRSRRRSGEERGRQRGPHPSAEPDRRHPAGRCGHGRRRAHRLRRTDGAARSSPVHGAGLALGPRLRHRRRTRSAAGRRHRGTGHHPPRRAARRHRHRVPRCARSHLAGPQAGC